MDIRNFFAPSNKGKKVEENKKRKKYVIEDSDSEEEPIPKSHKKSKTAITDSDDDIFVVEPNKKKKEIPKKIEKQVHKPSLKKSSVMDFFGSMPVQRSDRSSVVSDKSKKILEEKDKNFEKTLIELDSEEENLPNKKVKIDSPKRVPLLDKRSGNDIAKKDNSKEKTDLKVNGKEVSPKKTNNESNRFKDKGSKSKLKHISDSNINEKKKLSPKKREDESKIHKDNEGKKKTINENERYKDKGSKSKLKHISDSKINEKEKLSPKKREDESKSRKDNEGKKKMNCLTDTKVNGKEKLSPKKIEGKSENHNDSKSKIKSKEYIGNNTKKSKNSRENKCISKIEIIKEIKPKKAATPEKLDDSIIPATPEEKTVNPRALAYRKYLQRSGPKNPGSKSIPEGTPTCLTGLTFVLTGVLESFNREEVEQAIKERGGNVTKSVSKKTSFLLVGDEPGQSKTKKAEQIGIKFMSEDELLALIKSKTKPEAGHSVEQKNNKTPNKLLAEVTPSKNKKLKASFNQEESPVHSSKRKLDPKESPVQSTKRKVCLEDKMSPLRSSQSSTTSSLSQTSIPSTSGSPIGSKPTSVCTFGEDMWVDKYKPTSLKNIIGQQGDASNAKKLLNWLKTWSKNQSGKVKLVKPSPWAKDTTGAFFKAALLSGPPGVGKTTTVSVVCKQVEFDTVEFNASDTRSKRSMKEEIKELLSNMSLVGFQKGQKITRERVLVMDEVDGMAGNEDRGGMQELIALIKSTKIPIICMCNDRNSQKIRSLAGYCFDLRYNKPRVEQIRGAMMSVCFKEGIKIKPEALDEIIVGSNQDVRQVLNHLSVWSADNKHLDTDRTKKDAKMAKKEFKIGPWDVCSKVFNESGHKNMSIHDKIGLFFNDYSLGPLFVQHNYPKVSPICARGNPKMLLEQLAKTARSISDGDLVEKTIRSNNAWSLLPTQALFSSVLPGEYMAGYMSGQVEFPRWLGNFSKQKKFDRLSQELHTHMILRISGSKRDVLFDYAQHLCNSVVKPLATRGQDGIQDAVDVMTSYDLIREDLESLLELSSWPHSQEHIAKIDSKVKSAFTRTLNKSSHMNPYGVGNISKKKGKSSESTESEESDYEEEDDDDVNTDSMISVSKKITKPKTTAKAGTSRGKGKK